VTLSVTEAITGIIQTLAAGNALPHFTPQIGVSGRPFSPRPSLIPYLVPTAVL
jgi:hypothetical protein